MSLANSVLVTGANGFVGRALTIALLQDTFKVAIGIRQSATDLFKGVEQYETGNISSSTDWSQPLQNIDVVIHLAGRAHVLNDGAIEPLAEFRKTNTIGTLNLAKQAVEQGVKRFIFISSIGVNGNNNQKPFTELEQPNPQEPYAISKLEAEQGLLALAEETSMEVVIIRPPLVYGPNAPGNFGSLMRWVNKGIPLPLGAVYNQRSFVALDNLVSFIIHCIEAPKAVNEVFIISDGEDVSTTRLLQKVAVALDKKPRLVPIPVWLMALAARLTGRAGVANRLFGSLQVDSSKARGLLEWQPVITMDEQLKKIADEYLNEKTF